VSVVILNYKRRDALRRVLDSVRQQEYANREIILVDNNSQDEIRSFIETYAAEVELIELKENRGACGGRNAGIERARGGIIITLDNDIFFESPSELNKVVKTFEARPDVDILAFLLGDAETGEVRTREWCHPRNMTDYCRKEFETNYFVEGAVAYRRKVFEVAGTYYEPIFLGHEGCDLALRVLDHGFRILYTPQIRTRHLASSETRSWERTFYIYTRNYIWIAYKDFEFVEGMRFLIPKLAMMAFFSLRVGHWKPFLRGLVDGVGGLRRIRSERTPISRSTAHYLAELDSNRPKLMVRLARHRTGPQI
jgi:GT2 family glycosyltransferase